MAGAGLDARPLIASDFRVAHRDPSIISVAAELRATRVDARVVYRDAGSLQQGIALLYDASTSCAMLRCQKRSRDATGG